VNENTVPIEFAAGVVRTAVENKEKSEKSALVVPDTDIVQVMFVPTCATGVVQARAEAVDG